eukprot:NODE_284_length_10808_cov_1.215613.p2 type:complete len:445 gc:universal NODE_284_length_10808_cov_1.215613:7912-6578(-)
MKALRLAALSAICLSDAFLQPQSGASRQNGVRHASMSKPPNINEISAAIKSKCSFSSGVQEEIMMYATSLCNKGNCELAQTAFDNSINLISDLKLHLYACLDNGYDAGLAFLMHYLTSLTNQDVKDKVIGELFLSFKSATDSRFPHLLHNYPQVITNTELLTAFMNQLTDAQKKLFKLIIFAGKSEYGDHLLLKEHKAGWIGFKEDEIKSILAYQMANGFLGATKHVKEITQLLVDNYDVSLLDFKHPFTYSRVPVDYRVDQSDISPIMPLINKMIEVGLPDSTVSLKIFNALYYNGAYKTMWVLFSAKTIFISPRSASFVFGDLRITACDTVIEKLILKGKIQFHLSSTLLKDLLKSPFDENGPSKSFIHHKIVKDYKTLLKGKMLYELQEMEYELEQAFTQGIFEKQPKWSEAYSIVLRYVKWKKSIAEKKEQRLGNKGRFR